MTHGGTSGHDVLLATKLHVPALRALALAAQGEHASALGALTEALTLAGRHGYVRVFADEGAPMHALLCELSAPRPGQSADRGIDAGYLASVLRACDPAPRGLGDPAPRRRGDPAPRRRAWPSR
ncbi:MAG: hypothetical protein JO345_25270 [Streptosporangiaceae bacterium]|nr:hypothetical protein [Streptosporangiaceae bacterium]